MWVTHLPLLFVNRVHLGPPVLNEILKGAVFHRFRILVLEGSQCPHLEVQVAKPRKMRVESLIIKKKCKAEPFNV